MKKENDQTEGSPVGESRTDAAGKNAAPGNHSRGRLKHIFAARTVTLAALIRFYRMLGAHAMSMAKRLATAEATPSRIARDQVIAARRQEQNKNTKHGVKCLTGNGKDKKKGSVLTLPEYPGVNGE